MDALALALLVAGVAAIAVAAFGARRPLATIRQLDATEANLARYDSWRGKRTGVEADGPTGADIMRQQMRRRLLLWGGVAVAGAVAVVLGLLLS